VSRDLTSACPTAPTCGGSRRARSSPPASHRRPAGAAAKALELGPEDPANHELRAQIALRTGDRKTGRAALEKALGLTTDEPTRKRLHDLLRLKPTVDHKT
jgi:uncharacterized protein YifE (UPF0438 family)